MPTWGVPRADLLVSGFYPVKIYYDAEVNGNTLRKHPNVPPNFQLRKPVK
jgi:hypothetical protein